MGLASLPCDMRFSSAARFLVWSALFLCGASSPSLFLACREGTLEDVHTALQSAGERSGVTAVDGVLKQTPLMVATIRGHYDIVEYLIERGSPLKAVDDNGRRALELAADNYHRKVWDLLSTQEFVRDDDRPERYKRVLSWDGPRAGESSGDEAGEDANGGSSWDGPRAGESLRSLNEEL